MQSLLFLRPDDESGSGGTLSGNKKDVYVLLKIIKLIRNGSVTSFTLKYAIDRGLEDVVYETAALGPSLERVLRYFTLRGKLDGVNDDLAKIGVKTIKIYIKSNYETELMDWMGFGLIEGEGPVGVSARQEGDGSLDL